MATLLRSAVLLLAGLLAAWGAAPAAWARTVTIVLPNNVNTFDPHMSATVGTDLSVVSHVYMPLVIRGPDLQLHPALASSWQTNDERTWRFVLKSGFTFADGEPLDAAAVAWNLARVRDPKVNARIRAWFDPIKDVRVISPTELEITTVAPWAALAGQLSMFFLLPPNWTAAHNPAAETLSGGPYAIAENVPGDHITLKANPGFAGDKPAFDTVVFRIIPEPASRIAALLAGEVDLITALPTSEIARINKSGRADAGAIPSIRSPFIRFDDLKSPFAGNRALRLALNYAVDKQAIVDSIFDGHAQVSDCQVTTRNYFGFNPALRPIPYDPEKARALLKQSGFPAGGTIEMDVPTDGYPQASDVAQAAAAQIEELGVHVKINEMDFSRFMDRYLKSRTLSPLSYVAMAWPTLDADGLLTLFAPDNQYAYWHDDEFGKLLDQARSTLDPAVREVLYAQATQRMCDEAPVLFLFTQPTTYGVSRRITWRARGDDWVRAFDMAPVGP